MNRKAIRRLLTCVALLLICAWELSPLPASAGAPIPSQTAVRASLKTYYAWMNAPLTDDDRPYQALRNHIEQALSSGRKPAEVAKEYQNAAVREPADALAKFGYYYAASRAANVPNGISPSDAMKAGNDFESLIEKHSLPHTYNYARLAFLNGVYAASDIRLISMGRRLMKRDPQDSSVEYALAKVLTYSDAPLDFTQAVALQQDLARRFPNSPKTYWLLGDIYYHTAYRSHNQADVERTIAAYQHVLDVAPPTPEVRDAVRVTVLFIRNLEARWKKA